MRKSQLLLLSATILLIVGCATVEHPNVTKIPGAPPAVSPAIAEKSVAANRSLKRKVAIARFSNETQYGRSFLVDSNSDPLGKQAVDILSKKLLQTGRFVLLERADLGKINAELSIADRGALKNSADYLIVGSVTEFGRRTEGEVGVFSRTKKQTAFAKVTIRLVDVKTGQVIYAEDGSGEAFSTVGEVLGVGSRADYDSTLNDRALDTAIGNLASNVIENLLKNPWRSYVLSYDDGSYIISGGASQGIKIGDTFDVFSQGKTIKNPQTGMDVTLPGKKVAQIIITGFAGGSAENELSLAKVSEGTLPTAAEPTAFQSLFIQESSFNP
ncbi:MAG: CsgG/HfaB family protein [Opitutaceae bacterium]|nr:CsgG/HfaB family protein [Opitutaceae bacterium]